LVGLERVVHAPVQQALRYGDVAITGDNSGLDALFSGSCEEAMAIKAFTA
jgi:hypothetical protein